MYFTQGIHRAVKLRGSATATIFGDRRRSWTEHGDRVSRLATGLRSLGVEPGDRVAIIAHNSDLYIEAMNAIAWAGGVAVPGNFRWHEAEHEYALRDSGARILIVDRDHEAMARGLARSCDIATRILLDAGTSIAPEGFHSSEGLIGAAEPMADACRRGTDLCLILYTGGTTGKSKGVMLSHQGLIGAFLSVNASVTTPGEQIFLHSAPMFHLAGATTVLAVTLTAGTHVILPAFSPAAVIETIERERVTAALMVPTMFAMLREHLDSHPANVSSLRYVRYGAAPITETLLRQAMTMFPNAEFMQGYGQTELSSSVTVLEPRYHDPDSGRSALRSAGRPVIGADVRIVDDQMRELPNGAAGEIVARSPGAMLGYWNNPELTASTLVDGWVRTGDVGYFDDDGFLFVVDRLKDMIVSGGENVFSAEVENILIAHPAVAECAVIGVPDPKWGERVHAVVRLSVRSAATVEELQDHCRAGLAAYKCPRSFEFIDGPLPLSAQGKVLKADLRAPYWAGQQRRVG